MRIQPSYPLEPIVSFHMLEIDYSMLGVFFWFGFSITFILFIFLKLLPKSAETNENRKVLHFAENPFLRLMLMLIMFNGVWGVAVLLGQFNDQYAYINQLFILGIAIGLLVGNRLISSLNLKAQQGLRETNCKD